MCFCFFRLSEFLLSQNTPTFVTAKRNAWVHLIYKSELCLQGEGMAAVIGFYKGTKRVGDLNEEKSFDEWMLATDREWHDCHCFIQWLFPLLYASPHAINAYLNEDGLVAFRRGIMKAKMTRAYYRFLEFLGFDIQTMQLLRSDRINGAAKRISRVLASLKLVGLTNLSASFLRLLIEVDFTSKHESMRHWKDSCLGAEWAFKSNKECLKKLSIKHQPIALDASSDDEAIVVHGSSGDEDEPLGSKYVNLGGYGEQKRDSMYANGDGSSANSFKKPRTDPIILSDSD